VRVRAWFGFGVFALLAFALSGCGGNKDEPPSAQRSDDRPTETRASAGGTSSSSVGDSEASCAPAVIYRGHLYVDYGVEVVPPEGRPLLMGTVPGCDDTGHEPGPGSREEVELAPIEGVPPDIALLQHGVPDTVFVRAGFDGPLPPELRLAAPTCEPRDEPIQLAGRWLGIFGRDDPTTEVDLASPYDVKLFVAESSAPRYERAYVVVRVSADLERPLTRTDLRFLWDGRIELTVVCRDGRYLAETVAVYPPG
jgi:hypothetical protein